MLLFYRFFSFHQLRLSSILYKHIHKFIPIRFHVNVSFSSSQNFIIVINENEKNRNTTIHRRKTTLTDWTISYLIYFKKKDNKKAEPIPNDVRYTTNFNSPGSVPKRYRSVITKDTPVTTFGVKTEESRARSHSVSSTKICLVRIDYLKVNLAGQSHWIASFTTTIETCSWISQLTNTSQWKLVSSVSMF